MQTDARTTISSLATYSERLLLRFDELITADDIQRTSISTSPRIARASLRGYFDRLGLPPVKQPLASLVKSLPRGRSDNDARSIPLVERKQRHWPALPWPNDPLTADRLAPMAIVTEKTTSSQIETIKHRDLSYEVRITVCVCRRPLISMCFPLQRYNALLVQIRTAINTRHSEATADLDRHRSYWQTSIEQLRHVNES